MSLEHDCVPLCDNFLLQLVYATDGELEALLQIQENHDKHQSNKDAGFTDLLQPEEGDDHIQRKHKCTVQSGSKVKPLIPILSLYRSTPLLVLKMHFA